MQATKIFNSITDPPNKYDLEEEMLDRETLHERFDDEDIPDENYYDNED